MTSPPSFSDLTTIRAGGPPTVLVTPTSQRDLVDALTEAWRSGDPWLVLGGGSNLVVADEGFDGTVVHVGTRGIEELHPEVGSGSTRVLVQAGETWDDVVKFAVARGLAGIEALSGIPGSAGAAPVQNIGAYGQELASTLVGIEFLDYASGELASLPAAELGLGYRTSALKVDRAGLVVSIELELAARDGRSEPVAYPQLAAALGVPVGATVPLADVRASVLALRAAKGMLLDPADPDSVSCGSFFTNPIVSAEFAATLPAGSPRWPLAPEVQDAVVPLGQEPAVPTTAADDRVKLSAAWLIEGAGITRGFRLPGSRAHISTKHALAIVNGGGASASDVAELARFIHMRVLSEFGLNLQPEPRLVGLHL